MSHLKQREEKNCLNCNALVNDRYCSICGQENLQPQESLWHLITHFFNDITHFDGKFFSSVKYVVAKPGFLTSEYIVGRRVSYLNPVRFYVFTSALFFFIMFSFFINDKDLKLDENEPAYLSKKDSIAQQKGSNIAAIDSINANEGIKKSRFFEIIDSAKKNSNNNSGSFLGKSDYRDRKQFDSLDRLGKVKANFIKRALIDKQFELKEKYDGNNARALNAVLDNLIHLVPQILFLSLPFFALILKLLYIRRKRFYYVAHIIFTIHLYIFVYIQLLVISIFDKLAEHNYLSWLHVINTILGLGFFYYLYRAMRTFYEQGRGKTLAKLVILSLSLVFFIVFFLFILLGFSIYKM